MRDSGIPSWAVRGSRVVCIQGDEWRAVRGLIGDPERQLEYPVRGVIYTIREVRIRYVPEYGEVLVGLLLREVMNPIASGGSAAGEEPAWGVDGFAPLRAAKHRAEARVPELVS